MSRATTLFVATDEQLARLFVGVRHSLPIPITSVQRNPVMHQVLATTSWDPGPPSSRSPNSMPSIYAPGGEEPVEPIIIPESRADIVLEETAPLRLRALPHAAVLGVTGLELETLTFVLLGEKHPPARIVDTEENDGFVDSLPTEALMPLAMLDKEQSENVTERWNIALRMTRRKADRASLLILRELAREAIAVGGHLLTHMPS